LGAAAPAQRPADALQCGPFAWAIRPKTVFCGFVYAHVTQTGICPGPLNT
jgi:hypothetical protein